MILLQPDLEGFGTLEQDRSPFERDDGFDGRHHLDLCGMGASAARGKETGAWWMVREVKFNQSSRLVAVAERP